MAQHKLAKKKAPAFKLLDKDGKPHALKDIDSAYTIVYFYPKDNTPGCTLEAQEFTGLLSEFEKRDVQIVGISGGDAKSKASFCKKHKLKVLLLSDPDFSVAKAYQAYGQKTFMGRKFNGIFRNTYLLDDKKKVLNVWESVKAAGHANEVLAFIDELA